MVAVSSLACAVMVDARLAGRRACLVARMRMLDSSAAAAMPARGIPHAYTLTTSDAA